MSFSPLSFILCLCRFGIKSSSAQLRSRLYRASSSITSPTLKGSISYQARLIPCSKSSALANNKAISSRLMNRAVSSYFPWLSSVTYRLVYWNVIFSPTDLKIMSWLRPEDSRLEWITYGGLWVWQWVYSGRDEPATLYATYYLILLRLSYFWKRYELWWGWKSLLWYDFYEWRRSI